MLRVAGQTGTVTVLQQTAREHNNPPALIKKQMMIEPTHNSRYSNNNNNKLYTTNNTKHRNRKQTETHTKAKQSPKNFYLYENMCLRERSDQSYLMRKLAKAEEEEDESRWSSHILKSISYICITFASCKPHVWHETHTNSQVNTHTRTNTNTIRHTYAHTLIRKH